MATVEIKRIYEAPSKNDGYRVLVDRIWPRGVSKEEAKLDVWIKEIAPSTELRKWFDHKPERFEKFKAKYRDELNSKDGELNKLRAIMKSKKLTLLYGAKNEEINQAVVLKELLTRRTPSP